MQETRSHEPHGVMLYWRCTPNSISLEANSGEPQNLKNKKFFKIKLKSQKGENTEN